VPVSPGSIELAERGSNSFAVVNVGAGSSITATVDTGSASLPLALSLCETNPITSRCVTPLGSSATVTTNTNATPTFGIFATANSPIAFDPAGSRIFVQFTDPSGTVRGASDQRRGRDAIEWLRRSVARLACWLRDPLPINTGYGGWLCSGDRS
jgi:hypothetical protein